MISYIFGAYTVYEPSASARKRYSPAGCGLIFAATKKEPSSDKPYLALRAGSSLKMNIISYFNGSHEHGTFDLFQNPRKIHLKFHFIPPGVWYYIQNA